MAFTYNLTTTRGQVRLRIGDTNSSDPLLTDAEIDYSITQRTGVLQSAIECVRVILAKIARDIDRSGAQVQSSRSQKTQHYRDLLKDLQAEAAPLSGVRCGGISIDDMADEVEDDDRTQPAFTAGDDDNTRSVP
jgi:hypothetical protein